MEDVRLQGFRRQLETLRDELETALAASDEASEPVSPDRAIGRLTRQDAMQAQQMTLELRRRDRLRLDQVRRALKRLDDGEYGYCARCEEEISPARLAVKPEASLCVECAGGGRR